MMENTSGETMVDSTTEQKDNRNSECVMSKDEKKELLSSTKNEKISESDSNSDDLNSVDKNNVLNSNSQFYESSDSKIGYAVKIDDDDTLSDIEDIKTDSADSEDSAIGSLPSDSAPNDREEDAQDRSDGSDSGLGSEITEDVKPTSFKLDLPSTSTINNTQSSDNGECQNHEENSIKNNVYSEQSPLHDDIPIKSSLKRKFCQESVNDNEPLSKKMKKSIKFDNITVYYFPRAQGFTCVPSQGGSTLGMEWEHTHSQKFTLTEHAIEQRRLHKQILQQIKSERNSLQGVQLSSSEDSDTEEEASDISESELDLDNYFFLQPVPTRQRRVLLRAAGVRKIEGYEKNECRDIRSSREFCGCACKGVCNPKNCSCSIAGIKCQVDRLNFPCGCTRDGCSNTTGRIEFNPVRVRTHFINTLMRIGLENKNEEHQETSKRQWAGTQDINTPHCLSNSVYETERCITYDDGLLRDVNLTPRVEVESCVNSGSFSNVHCDMNNSVNQNSNIQENVMYNYTGNELSNHPNLQESNIHFDGANHNNHADPYTSNILQGKGPPYPACHAVGFETVPHVQTFPCDLNYAYSQHPENHHFKSSQSFSASSFEEFAHNSQMSMFSHYGHMYVSDYLHKPNTSIHEHSSLQYHSMSQSHYEMYKNTSECTNTENKGDSHYTTLMTLPYPNSNKYQTENDENWFSQNTLLNLDHADQTQDSTDVRSQPMAKSSESSATEPTENFGELIKKTMVESVTV